MVWPLGWVCHAVRAPGVKWTLLALRRDKPAGAATASTYTAPVNHSLGPAIVGMLFRMTCMSHLLGLLQLLEITMRVSCGWWRSRSVNTGAMGLAEGRAA